MSAPIVILGTGLLALAEAVRLRAERPDAPLLLVDASPQPGGALSTLRTEGYLCELGWQALWGSAEPVVRLIESLGLGAAVQEARQAMPPALAAWFCGPAESAPAGAGGRPITFRAGLDELVQAARMALPGALLLGRPLVAASERAVVLGGDVPREIVAERVVRLPEERPERSACVQLGFRDTDVRDLEGEAGFVLEPGAHPQLRAAVFCSSLWPGRAQHGKALVRFAAARGAEPERLAADAERILRERHRITGPLLFRRVYG